MANRKDVWQKYRKLLAKQTRAVRRDFEERYCVRYEPGYEMDKAILASRAYRENREWLDENHE